MLFENDETCLGKVNVMPIWRYGVFEPEMGAESGRAKQLIRNNTRLHLLQYKITFNAIY